MGEPLDFEDIVDPVVAAIRKMYRTRRTAAKSVAWDGPVLETSHILANSLTIADRLSEEQLRYSREEQGRDELTEIVSVAVQLGIEQGFRINRQRNETSLKMARELLPLVLSSLALVDPEEPARPQPEEA